MSEPADPMQEDSAVYQTLLESTKAIPWRIDWKTLCFTYIGPQIERLLGWKRESWASVEDWASRMHPEDREWVVNYCVAQSHAGVDHEADYRALRSDGEYVWIRDVVHVERNPDGSVKALIGFMFDISERKRSEDRILALQRELEDLSFKDGLTGVANRRMVDTVLTREWSSARRATQPLSIILLDIDYFKEYNDLYGHLAGDDCLRKVAQALANAALRPRDFFGRFGGEEFLVVLPETDLEAAITVAERLRTTVIDLAIAHRGSTVAPHVTISLGLGTIAPEGHDVLERFLDHVDKLLYKAKQTGRNRAQYAQ